MNKNLLFYSLCSLMTLAANAQNKTEASQKQSSSYGQELYVSFAKNIQFTSEDYERTLLASIPQLIDIDAEFHLQFERGIAISNEKLAAMEKEALRVSKNSDAVQKLRNILKVKIQDATPERLLAVVTKMKNLPGVNYCDIVSLQPINPPGDIAPVTPNYETNQSYIQANPGVNMSYAWGLGLNGSGIRIRDVEYGFNKNHEELVDGNSKLAPSMTISSSASVAYTEHGTAVFGIVFADKGSYGISGMAYGAQEIVLFPEWQQSGYSRVNAVTKSIENSVSGDVIMYEMQTGGENDNYVAAEFDPIIWDLTKAASDAGIIVVAAAGNGNENLDGPYYTEYRDRGNSGAIIVGAGTANLAHNKESFSTYGSRVDVQGWGGNVRSSGYGNLIQVGGDFNQSYTNFSGTSSATPIVASCVIVLQSYYHTLTGNYMNSLDMRNLLISTGVAQGTGGHIGPLPNMQAAIDQINVLSSQQNPERITFSVFPNPAQETITVNMQEMANANSKLEIINGLGQSVFASVISNETTEIALHDLQSGLYFVKVSNGEKTAVKKIIKQ